MGDHLRSPDRLGQYVPNGATARPAHWGTPVDWLANARLNPGFHFHTFDFHVHVNTGLSHELWVKRLVPLELFDALELATTPDNIVPLLDDEADALADLNAVAQRHGRSVAVMLIPDMPYATRWARRDPLAQPAVLRAPLATEPTNAGGLFAAGAEWWTLAEVRDAIETHKGRPWRLGAKGLSWATSALEMFLATDDTMTPWPGDCDALVCENGEPKLILEWKKHTRARDAVTDHLFDRYYRRGDTVKWDNLAHLSKGLGGVPIVAVSWSIHAHHPHAAVQRIDGRPGSLTASRPKLVPIAAAPHERAQDVVREAYRVAGLWP